MVAAVWLTPGRISRAKARVFGNEAFSESRALLAFASVGPSRRIEARRSTASDAVAATVLLKFVTRSFSCSSLRPRPSVVRFSPAMSRDRSWSSVPRKASATIAVPRSERAP